MATQAQQERAVLAALKARRVLGHATMFLHLVPAWALDMCPEHRPEFAALLREMADKVDALNAAAPKAPATTPEGEPPE